MKRLALVTLFVAAGCGQQLVDFPRSGDLGHDQSVGDLGPFDMNGDAGSTDGFLDGDGGGRDDGDVALDLAAPVDLSFPFDLGGDMTPPCSALKLDGVHAIVTAASQTADNPIGAFTVEAWIFQTARTADSVVAGHWGDIANGTASYVLQIDATGHVVFRISSTGSNEASVTTSTTVPLSAWTHVAGQFTPNVLGSKLSAFVNGQNEADVTPTLVLIAASVNVPLHIGRFSSATTVSGGAVGEEPFTGYMHDVRYTPRALYPSAMTPPVRLAPDSSTIALYHFDESSGSNAADSSVHAVPGSLLNNAQFAMPPVCP